MDFVPVTGVGKRTSPEVAWLSSIDEMSEQKSDRSTANFKRGRSDDAWRGLRPSEVDFSSGKGGDNFATFGGGGSDDRHKMLSFSSSSSSCAARIVGGGDSGRNIGFSLHGRSTVGGSGGSDVVMQGPFARPKGPFTPSQWMELEHQALIYKHLVANVPVPSNLLLPLKRSLYSYGSTASYASNFLGWGTFHLGNSNNDPEPGRCRRTDGKKWRCSREAVPDQKYCERHINRGRHRSRKPVEGRTGHAVSGSTASKVAPIASSSSASVMSSAGAPNSLSSMQHQYNLCADVYSRSQGFQGLSLTPPTTDLKSKDATCSIQKQSTTFDEPANSEFVLGFSSDSLLNGSNSGSLLQLYSNETRSHDNPVHQFTDDWPKYQSVLNSDWTQLSMSIPMNRDLSPSTLKLSHDPYPVQKQSNSWLPVMWGSSVGGPLGEALTSKATIGESYLSGKPLKGSPQMGSSPTGVLQKPSTFIALSNSSYGSSPISGENKKVPENPTGPCDDLLSSATAAIPSQ